MKNIYWAILLVIFLLSIKNTVHSQNCGYEVDYDITIIGEDCSELEFELSAYIVSGGYDTPYFFINSSGYEGSSVNQILEPGSYTISIMDTIGGMTICTQDVASFDIPNFGAGSLNHVSDNNISSCIYEDGSIEFNSSSLTSNHGLLRIEWDGVVSGSHTYDLSSFSGYTIENLPAGQYNVAAYTINNIDGFEFECLKYNGVHEIGTNIPTQDICLVTVDEETADHNIVVWEKPMDLEPIDSFYIHREISAGVYEKIGAVEKDELSQFHDYDANPNSTGFRYKISILDVCGNESGLSTYHNTIHLQYQGNGNFNWNHYSVENQTDVVGTYNFYRDNFNTGDWAIIQVVSGTQNTFSDVDYQSFPDANYRVDVNWANDLECISTRAVSHNTSRSNVRGITGGGGGDECSAPVGVLTTNVSATTAEVYWASDADMWSIAYGSPGFNPDIAGNLNQGITQIPQEITGLSPETTYDVYVKAFCDGDPSDWSSVYTFTTSPLSVVNQSELDKILIFPNPNSSGMFEVNLSNAAISAGTVQVMDISGKVVLTTAFNSNYFIINLEKFVKGVYFAKIITQNELTKTYKLVKN